MARDTTTEQKIAEAAETVFLEKGIAGARMQEIADSAGINKALLHYYFRSKDKLFEYVFDRIFSEFVDSLREVFSKDTPIEQRIREFIRAYLVIFDKKPGVPLFIQTELYRNPALAKRFNVIESVFAPEPLRAVIQQKVDDGEWHTIRVADFLTNLIGLCVYPYLAKPLLQQAFRLDEIEYRQFLHDREETVYTFFMKGLQR